MVDIVKKTSSLPLGKQSEYVQTYMPSLLYPIARQDNRAAIGLTGEQLPFSGTDVWTAYELSWLDLDGKPQVAIGEFHFPSSCPAMIESKSFKLYLNSFNQTSFSGYPDVIQTLEMDLGTASKGPVYVRLSPLTQNSHRNIGHFAGESLDHLPVTVTEYQPNPLLLSVDNADHIVTESLYSDLLKTNCPVTGQPDWASVSISYRGAAINREGLLKYIISFRQHQDFHEHCIERMFVDLQARCKPEQLTVYGRYTRRGGLDINVFRTDTQDEVSDIRLIRQ